MPHSKKTTTVLVLLLATYSAQAASYKVLHGFGAGTDGAGIESGVVLDKKGNVYGTTRMGGAYGYGTVFKLTKKPDGRWAEKILQNFRNGDPNGYVPWGGLTFDDRGNLFGTATGGGKYQGGTVFEMTPGPTAWNFSVIYDFCSQPDCADGGAPEASMVFDNKGNLYGTAFNVFELMLGPDGWTESVLCHVSCDRPTGGLVLDAKGNLYGTTDGGGAYDQGTVFKLKPMPDGSWTERVLHSFGSFPEDGRQPPAHGALAFDSAGNLYGTTQVGGKYGPGTVFRLTRQPDGHWKETILHNFKAEKGGYFPDAGVVVDEAGNVYGTTGSGGSECGCGVVYRLAPNPDGTWVYTVLHRFKGYDGAFPAANLVLDDKGNLYGTTRYGGAGGGGVVFKIIP